MCPGHIQYLLYLEAFPENKEYVTDVVFGIAVVHSVQVTVVADVHGWHWADVPKMKCPSHIRRGNALVA